VYKSQHTDLRSPYWGLFIEAKMDEEWIPQTRQLLGIDRASLPIIWDADFPYGSRTDAGEDIFVLCETCELCVRDTGSGAGRCRAALILTKSSDFVSSFAAEKSVAAALSGEHSWEIRA
jgi:hypothetical protein